MTTQTSTDTAATNMAPGARPGAADRVPHDLFIAGQWQPAVGGGTMPVVNPATEHVIAEVADATVDDARRALRAAAEAQATWALTPARTRSEILYRTYELMVERTDLLAEVMTLEMGKPLAEARGEVGYAADLIRWFAEEAVRIDGGYAHRPDGAARNLQLKQPVGPCLLIVPWNFPLAMGARKIGPAIAAGCTSILKPAPQTPLSSLALAQLFSEAGLPDGVLNVLADEPRGRDRPADARQRRDPQALLHRLHRRRQAPPRPRPPSHVIRTSMELGGNAPFLVLDDADLDVAVDAAFAREDAQHG